MSRTNRKFCDTERIEFLALCLREGDLILQNETGHARQAGKVGLFTVPSQWVYGKTARAAIDAAMWRTSSRSKIWWYIRNLPLAACDHRLDR